MDPSVRLLRDLVAVDSVNPSLVPGGAGEAGIAAVLAGELRASGLDVEIAEAAPGRPNVVGILEGTCARPIPDALRSHGHGRGHRHESSV